MTLASVPYLEQPVEQLGATLHRLLAGHHKVRRPQAVPRLERALGLEPEAGHGARLAELLEDLDLRLAGEDAHVVAEGVVGADLVRREDLDVSHVHGLAHGAQDDLRVARVQLHRIGH